MSGVDTLIVDSIKQIILNDNKSYKHIFLNSQYQFKPIIWIEGLGEKSLRWIRYDFDFTQFPQLKAVCNNDLIYWDITFDGFNSKTVVDSCDFNNLLSSVSVNKIHINKMNVYPNPANNFINIEYPKSNSNDWEIYILDINGKMVFESKEALTQIPTSNLPNGTYLIQLRNKIYQYHETHQIIIQH
jgi:hypothetical protein